MNAPVNPRAVMGDNAPPLADRLKIEEAELLAEVDALAGRANELPRVLTDENSGEAIPKMGEVARDAAALVKRLEARRVEVKQPWLEGAQTVDDFYRAPKQRLSRVDVFCTGAVAVFREAKRQQEARIAAVAARQAAEEAAELLRQEDARRRAAAEAESKGRDATAALERQRADKAAQQAQEAQQRAAEASRPAEPPPAAVKAEIAPDVTMETKGEWQGCVLDRTQIDFAVLGPYFRQAEIEDALKRAVKNGVRGCRGAEVKFVEKVSFR